MIKRQQNAHELPEGWETLSIAIPRGLSDDIADFIGRHGSTVRKWRQRTENGSGEPSFLDMLYAAGAALAHYHPAGRRKLQKDIDRFWATLDAKTNAEEFDSRRAASAVAKESTEFVMSVLGRGSEADQERELLEMITIGQEHLERLQAKRRAATQLRVQK